MVVQKLSQILKLRRKRIVFPKNQLTWRMIAAVIIYDLVLKFFALLH